MTPKAVYTVPLNWTEDNITWVCVFGYDYTCRTTISGTCENGFLCNTRPKELPSKPINSQTSHTRLP